jgi:hypothetical protein
MCEGNGGVDGLESPVRAPLRTEGGSRSWVSSWLAQGREYLMYAYYASLVLANRLVAFAKAKVAATTWRSGFQRVRGPSR